MATTVRINEDVKQLLKIKCAELGVKQVDLLNRYVLEGIKRDDSLANKGRSVEELDALLKHDNPGGNDWDSISGIVGDPMFGDEVEEKRSVWRG